MTPAYLLLGLRLLSAVLLLFFLAGVAWLVYQDLRFSAMASVREQRSHGHLLVIASEEGGPTIDTRFPLLPVTSIGRAQGNTIVLNDGYASSDHALITLRGTQWWLADLSSRNGTLLNDLPLTETVVVSAGDVIAVGGTQLKIIPAQNNLKEKLDH